MTRCTLRCGVALRVAPPGDGRRTVFAEQSGAAVAWAPVPGHRRVAGGAILQLMVSGEGRFRIPAATLSPEVQLVVEGPTPGSRGAVVPSRREDDMLVFTATPDLAGRWIYGVVDAWRLRQLRQTASA